MYISLLPKLNMLLRTEDLLFHDQMEIRPQENQNSWLPLLRMYTDVRI